MNYSKLIVPVSALALLISAVPAAAHEVDANVGASVQVNGGPLFSGKANADASADDKTHDGQDRMQHGEDRGANMIDARIKTLQNLSARIGGMKRLSASQIASLQASIKAQIDVLTTLEATIKSDTSTTTLKGDVGSITKDFRVYLLVVPQAQISAAADRILTIAGQMENLSTKLSARISAAASAGTDVTAMNAALSDFNAKVADAKVQANAAISATVNLKPDNGDASVKASNTAALKDARSKLAAARQDLAAAYKDAATIAGKVKGKGTATTTAKVHVEAGDNH